MSDDVAAPSASPHLPLAEQVQVLRRLALAATRSAGPEIYQALVAEVARALKVRLAMVAVFADERRTMMRMLAAVVDGEPMPPVEYPLAQSPCAEVVVGKGYRFVACGILAGYGSHPTIAELGLDAYAAFPMRDSRGEPLGLVAVFDPQTIAGGDADHAEAVLKIAAVRLAAELERSAASEALRRSAASYRAIFEAAEDSILVHDRETFRLVDVNAKAVHNFGYTREELLNIDPAELMSGEAPYDMAHAVAHFELAKLGRCPPFEWQTRLKDGRLQWQEVRLKPVTIDGRAQILAFARDITERKAAEEQLRASEEQHRSIFNASLDAALVKDAEHRIVDVNEAYVRMLGYERHELMGKQLSQFVPPELRARCDVLVPQILAGQPCQLEATMLRRDGSRIEVEIRGTPAQYGGRTLALLIMRDITERKAAEARLRVSEAQYRAIFDASADALMLWDSRLKRVDVNPAHERIFGFARDDVVGRGFENLNYPEEFARPRLELVQRALAGEPSRVELEALRKDGRRILTELRTIPFQHRGEPHVLQIARDITDRRAAEAERSALEAQLRQAQKMEAIGQLTGGIAHDFNNILTSVIGYIVLAQERAERQGDATLVRQLGSAQTAAQRARELIAQMLAFARRQRGDRRVIALAPVVRQAMQLLRSTMPTSIVLDDTALGDNAELPPVHADTVQIEQVLLNLCINARDAMQRSGRIAVRLRESTRAPMRCTSCGATVAPGRWLEIEVTDTGSGIAPEVLPRMFEPFFTTKEVGRGSGMGLAMVHGIVHDYEGHVLVDSAPGQGSTFRVLLPAASGATDAAAPGDATRDTDVPLLGRVMLVEDEPTVAAFMRELLEGWGLEVVAPADARAAANWFDDPTHEVDLVLTDLTMPQMTGLELSHHVGVLRPDLPVLLYSGDAEGLDDGALRRAGVRARVDKPVDPQRLKSLLQRWLVTR